MKNGPSIHTYVSDIYIENKEKQMCVCGRSVGVVASSERIIVIALAGKHIFLFFDDYTLTGGVCRTKQQTCRKKMMTRFLHLSMKTTIINSFPVCLLC
jgi:hypothetical protein